MKNIIYYFRLNLLLVLFIIVGLNLPVTGQNEKTPKRKKFGWSLKKPEKKPEKNSKINKPNAETDEDEVIKIDTDLIINDILVLDQKGKPVDGLKQTDFVVVEDDVTQEIEVFSSTAIKKQIYPRYFVFIIDHNNSQHGHIRNTVDAAKLFVDKLAPQDRMAIVTDEVKLIQDFTNDKTKLKEKLESVYKRYISPYTAGGHGYSYTALFTVLNEMFDKDGIRPIVILQSNGRELYMLKDGKRDASRSEFALYYGFQDFTYEDILRKIVEKRVTIYSIIPGRRFAGLSDDEKIRNLVLFQIDHQYDHTPIKLRSIEPRKDDTQEEENMRRILQEFTELQSAVAEIAETSGGTVNYLQTPEDAKTIYSDIFSTIDKRYLIGYYSTNQEQDNKLRKIKIEVRNHPEYIILGRKTYIPR